MYVFLVIRGVYMHLRLVIRGVNMHLLDIWFYIYYTYIYISKGRCSEC